MDTALILANNNAPQVMNNNANAAATTLANALNQQSGIIDLSQGRQFELYVKPTSTVVTTYGLAVDGTTPGQSISYIFNEAIYKTSVLSADGTSASKQPTYNDGTFHNVTGGNINRHILCDNLGRGLNFKLITFVGIDGSGNQDITILQNMNLTVQTYNTQGGSPVPQTFDVSSAIRNTQFQSGILTVALDVWVNAETQMVWTTAAGATITATFIWN